MAVKVRGAKRYLARLQLPFTCPLPAFSIRHHVRLFDGPRVQQDKHCKGIALKCIRPCKLEQLLFHILDAIIAKATQLEAIASYNAQSSTSLSSYQS